MKLIVACRQLGVVDYRKVQSLQEGVFDTLVEQKKQRRDAERSGTKQGCLRGEGIGQRAEVQGEEQSAGALVKETLFLCEHNHVYTLGKSGEQANMLIGSDFLEKIGAVFVQTDRGGDITYHGPGQLVGYPILDLERHKMGLKEYIERLEQSIIDTLAEYGIEGYRVPNVIGVWVGDGASARKIAAIGVRSSSYVTMHGFALNVDPKMEYFSYINPCGFTDKGVTSMAIELNRKVTVEQVQRRYREHFERVFSIELEP